MPTDSKSLNMLCLIHVGEPNFHISRSTLFHNRNLTKRCRIIFAKGPIFLYHHKWNETAGERFELPEKEITSHGCVTLRRQWIYVISTWTWAWWYKYSERMMLCSRFTSFIVEESTSAFYVMLSVCSFYLHCARVHKAHQMHESSSVAKCTRSHQHQHQLSRLLLIHVVAKKSQHEGFPCHFDSLHFQRVSISIDLES